MEILKTVYVSRVVADITQDKKHWLWFPTVQKSILAIDDGCVKVIYSETNQHKVTGDYGDTFDNYQAAFIQACARLRAFSSAEFKTTEQNVERLYVSIKDEYNFDDFGKRKIVYKDLNKEETDK